MREMTEKRTLTVESERKRPEAAIIEGPVAVVESIKHSSRTGEGELVPRKRTED